MTDKELLESINNKLLSIISLTIYYNNPDLADNTKIESLLDKCGIAREEISTITGKSRDAVSKIIQRSK